MEFILKKYKSKKTGGFFYYLQYKNIEVRFEHVGMLKLNSPTEKDYTKTSIRRSNGQVSTYMAFNRQTWNKDVCDGVGQFIWIKNTFPEYQDLYSAALKKEITLQR